MGLKHKMISYAFVIKNFVPVYKKVQILHAQYGKVLCVYPQKHQGALLTTGSVILCQIEPFNRAYRFEYLEIVRSTNCVDVMQLQFIHEIMLICLKFIPNNVAVSDIVEFLLYLYRDIDNVSSQGKNIALLRLFLLCGLLPETQELYRIAMQDPYGKIVHDDQLLQRYVQFGWDQLVDQGLL